MRTNAVLSSDTSLAAEFLQMELWRKMSPLEKAKAVSEISRAVQELSFAGIRLRLAINKLRRPLACEVDPEPSRISGR